MAIALSTAGINLYYAVEVTAGTRPTSGYILIPDVVSTPDLNPAPSNLDATSLSEPEWRQYIPGLKDIGDSLAFTFNNTDAFQETWSDLVEAAKTASDTGKATWFVLVVPGLENAFYFAGTPTPLGLSAMKVDTVLQVDGYVSPEQMSGWQTKPTTGTP